MVEVLTLFGGFLVLIAIGIPIGISMGIAGILTIYFTGANHALYQAIAQKMYTGIDSFALMAIPFFILAGDIMNRGGMSVRLISFFKLLLRKIPATTAVITTVTSAFFGALTGSTLATIAAVGGITIPMMEEAGYSKGDASAIAAASGILGPIIPPSITMITYAIISGVSISTMFLAGIIPGILIAFIYIIIELILYGKIEKGVKEKLPKGKLWKSFKEALLALGMPVIILGGIYGGIFTPTEAAVIACIYSLIITLFIYKEVKFSELPKIFFNSAISTSRILFILCLASSYAWLMTNFGLIKVISEIIINLGNKILILMAINIIMLILGCFIDATSIIIIVTPIFLPVATSIGMSHLALGLIIIVNVACGALTPPLAPNIYLAANIAKTRSISATTNAVMPLLMGAVLILLILTYAPDVILWLPRILGEKIL